MRLSALQFNTGKFTSKEGRGAAEFYHSKDRLIEKRMTSFVYTEIAPLPLFMYVLIHVISNLLALFFFIVYLIIIM